MSIIDTDMLLDIMAVFIGSCAIAVAGLAFRAHRAVQMSRDESDKYGRISLFLLFSALLALFFGLQLVTRPLVASPLSGTRQWLWMFINALFVIYVYGQIALLCRIAHVHVTGIRTPDDYEPSRYRDYDTFPERDGKC